MQQLSINKRICCFLLILLGFWVLLMNVLPTAAQGARVWLDPATLELSPGNEGDLDIRVEDVTELAGAEVHLAFDPALLEVVDVDPSTDGLQIAHGDFLSPDFVAQNIADPTTGTVDYAIACIPLDKAVSGSGVLARITFRALDGGQTLVETRSVLLADKQKQPIAVDTEESVVVISHPGRSLAVWVLIGLVAVAVAAGFIAVVWSTVRAR
jgi:hypothetical protein